MLIMISKESGKHTSMEGLATSICASSGGFWAPLWELGSSAASSARAVSSKACEGLSLTSTSPVGNVIGVSDGW